MIREDMSIKKDAETLNPALLTAVDHSLVRQIVDGARICDQAVDCCRQGDFEDALQRVFPLIIQEIPVISERAKNIAAGALDELADRSHDQEDYTKEIEYLNQWLLLKPRDLYPIIRKGEILLYEIDDLNAAYEAYQTASAMHPDSVEAWIGLSEIDYYRERYHTSAQHLIIAWQVLEKSEWGYPKTEAVLTNVFETLYFLTGRLIEILGDKGISEETVREGIKALGGYSAYLQERFALNEDNSQGKG